jgi:Flp pilus assembly protein TadB
MSEPKFTKEEIRKSMIVDFNLVYSNELWADVERKLDRIVAKRELGASAKPSKSSWTMSRARWLGLALLVGACVLVWLGASWWAWACSALVGALILSDNAVF